MTLAAATSSSSGNRERDKKREEDEMRDEEVSLGLGCLISETRTRSRASRVLERSLHSGLAVCVCACRLNIAHLLPLPLRRAFLSQFYSQGHVHHASKNCCYKKLNAELRFYYNLLLLYFFSFLFPLYRLPSVFNGWEKIKSVVWQFHCDLFAFFAFPFAPFYFFSSRKGFERVSRTKIWFLFFFRNFQRKSIIVLA